MAARLGKRRTHWGTTREQIVLDRRRTEKFQEQARAHEAQAEESADRYRRYADQKRIDWGVEEALKGNFEGVKRVFGRSGLLEPVAERIIEDNKLSGRQKIKAVIGLFGKKYGAVFLVERGINVSNAQLPRIEARSGTNISRPKAQVPRKEFGAGIQIFRQRQESLPERSYEKRARIIKAGSDAGRLIDVLTRPQNKELAQALLDAIKKSNNGIVRYNGVIAAAVRLAAEKLPGMRPRITSNELRLFLSRKENHQLVKKLISASRRSRNGVIKLSDLQSRRFSEAVKRLREVRRANQETRGRKVIPLSELQRYPTRKKVGVG